MPDPPALNHRIVLPNEFADLMSGVGRIRERRYLERRRTGLRPEAAPDPRG